MSRDPPTADLDGILASLRAEESAKSAARIMMGIEEEEKPSREDHNEVQAAKILMFLSRDRRRYSSPSSERDEDTVDEDGMSERGLDQDSMLGPLPTGNEGGLPTPPDSQSNKLRLQRTLSNATSADGESNVPDADPDPLHTFFARRRPAKRKAEEDLPEPGEAEKKPFTRKRDKAKSPREVFGAFVKLAENAWEAQDKTPTQGPNAGVSSNRLRDEARRLLPPDGEGTPRHDEEMIVARAAGFTPDQYYSLKYRTILCDAAFVEQNIRVATSAPTAATTKRRCPYWNFSVAHAQMCSNRDVSRMKPLFEAWKAWGWIPDMFAPDGKTLNPELKTLFPAEIRSSLMADIERYEDSTPISMRGPDYPIVNRQSKLELHAKK